MKSIIFMLFFAVVTYATDLNIYAYKANTLFCEYHFTDVKNWKWLNSSSGNKFIRVYFNRTILDLPLGEYDVTIGKN